MNAMNMKLNYRYLIAACLTGMLLTGLFSSCSSLIDEDMSDCRYGCGVRFEYLIYDDTGGAADAFSSSVDRVSLYIFDAEDRYLRTVEASGADLTNPDWRMELDLEAGTYRLVAWAGLDGTSFTAPAAERLAAPADAYVTLNIEGSTSQTDLHPLWNGMLEVEVKEEYQEFTISLIKDTRRIRIVLQQINGEPVNIEDYGFEITDDNSRLGYDNLPIANGTVTYLPYASGEQSVGGEEDGTGTTTVAYAELSTSRLVAGNVPRLRIYRTEDNEEVVNIPLLDYLLLIKSAGSRLTVQQFLDRTDTYSLVFFLDSYFAWLQTTIIVNGWTVRVDSATIGG